VIGYPRSRDLDGSELTDLVKGLSSRPDLWQHLVRHEPGQRVYEQLWRDEHVAAWVICWMRDHDTGFHDHDLSAGAVAVVAGTLCEERLTLSGGPLRRTFGAGTHFDFAASEIHRVYNETGAPAVTLHAYSPPLWRMGAYEVQPSGVLARHSVSYAEELRPLAPGLA
jgi:Cysteine dioxygenase type I